MRSGKLYQIWPAIIIEKFFQVICVYLSFLCYHSVFFILKVSSQFSCCHWSLLLSGILGLVVLIFDLLVRNVIILFSRLCLFTSGFFPHSLHFFCLIYLSLPNRKAVVADNLKGETLKQIASYILSHFTYIWNQCVEKCIYPNAFKKSW